MLSYHGSHHDGQSALKLKGALTIYTAAEARREIPTRLAKHKSQVLDLSGIDELDTAGVQLLLWLKRDLANRGTTLALANHSPAVVDVLDLLRLTAVFGGTILLSPPETGSRHGS
jgi:anti-anti-sigma factor